MRTAACHCGGLKITCRGDPLFVAMCHCTLCQRRTGSTYNLGAWFDRQAIEIAGAETVYTRQGDDTGTDLHFHFCPRCGTNVYWETTDGSMPGKVGIAVGCFADPGFPAPSLSVYENHRHRWVEIPEAIPRYSAAFGRAEGGGEG